MKEKNKTDSTSAAASARTLVRIVSVHVESVHVLLVRLTRAVAPSVRPGITLRGRLRVRQIDDGVRHSRSCPFTENRGTQHTH